MKVEREQLSFCSWKPGKVGSQVVFAHLIMIVVNNQFDLDPHLKAERDQAGERSLPHLGLLGSVRLNKEGGDLGAHLVDSRVDMQIVQIVMMKGCNLVKPTFASSSPQVPSSSLANR